MKQKAEKPTEIVETNSKDMYSNMKFALEFVFCFISLQASYLIWGIMQELIMNTKFNSTPLNPSGRFPSASFCVFSNRFVAIIVSSCVCWYYHGSGSLTGTVPLLSFTPCALSNTISSWCQYKALEYVSFSLQTLFKSTKVIPVMLMGTILKNSRYSTIEYVEAVLITSGVCVFSLAKSNWSTDSNTFAQTIGLILLCVYVLSDSFTSQWQSRLYKDYGKIDSFQMMCGVNISSIVITSMALIVSGELPLVLEFLWYNPNSLMYNIITSVVSTTGQLAIYYTIKKFGPIVFTVIMTTRQMFSIVLSNYLFSHSMTLQNYLGASLVFAVLLYSTYRQMHAASAAAGLREKDRVTVPNTGASSSTSLVESAVNKEAKDQDEA